jgi:predicted ATPase/class 3 adenylate cyclase/Tfp pilus assembly protein PilF
MSGLPSGTVTFLFTDIERSTTRWEHQPQAMEAAVERHDAIMRGAIEANDGFVFRTEGDAFRAVFDKAPPALDAAIQAQRALETEPWAEDIAPLRVRMALHTGAIEARGSDYVGPSLNRMARLLSAAHGGQTLLSMATQQLVRDYLSPGVTLRDMGEHNLKDLIYPERVFQVVVPGLQSEFPPLQTPDTRPNNLPRKETALIGREKEIAAVWAMLRGPDVALVTLTGPGGTGKTRLGLQVAADLLDDFHDGVWFVDLAPLTDPNLVASTIASVLGVKERPDQPLLDTLKDYLRDKQMLLMLDTFERMAADAAIVDSLLKSSPGLKVLATSRTLLRMYGEKTYPVPPLAVPDMSDLPSLDDLTHYEAVRLFADRATDIEPDFKVAKDNALAVAEICVRLDGLPLAIELAAARIGLLPPQAMLRRLTSRLKLLKGGARTLPARHQTLRNTIEWSYDLLEQGEKQLFRRMAVFQGGRTLEALEAVCNFDGELEADVLEGVGSLVSNNLLRQREGRDGEPNFWLLETIDEYAREKLAECGEREPLRREHAMYFMALAEEAEPHLTGVKQAEWLHRLEDEHDNFRAALRWAQGVGEGGEAEGAAGESENKHRDNEDKRVTGDVEPALVGLRIAGALGRFWEMRGHLTEGRQQLEEMLASSARPPMRVIASQPQSQTLERTSLRAKALDGTGTLAYHQGEYASARSLYEESLAIKQQLGDKMGIAFSLNGLGLVVHRQGEYAVARSLYEESLVISRQLADKRGIAGSLNNLGNVAYNQGEYAAARSLYKESLAIRRELGDNRGIANSLNGLGGVAYRQREYAAARSLYEESLAIKQQLGDKMGIASSLGNLGNVAYYQGEYAAARSLYEESLAISRQLGDKEGSASSLNDLGNVAYNQGEYAAARSLHEESLAMRRELGDNRGIAFSLTNLGNVAYMQGEYAAARSLYEESLAVWRELENTRGLAICLAGLGGVAVGAPRPRQAQAQTRSEGSRGQAKRGARLLGAAEALLEAIRAIVSADDRMVYEQGVASAHAQLSEEEFEKAWAKGRTMNLEQAIAYALEGADDEHQ